MNYVLFYQLLLTLFAALVCYLDATRFTIPNWLNGLLIVLYPVMVMTVPGTVDWQSALIAMGGTFAVGFAVFAFGWLGGGDVKLLIACALWTGLSQLPELLIWMGILGGVLAVGLLCIRKLTPIIAAQWEFPAERIPRLFTMGEPAPYGLAIAAALMLLTWQGRLPGLY